MPIGSVPTLHVGSLDNGPNCTSDGGASWAPSSGWNACFDAIAMAFAPSNPSRAYALTCDPNSILRTDNAVAACGTVVWTAVSLADAWRVSALHWSRHLISIHPFDLDRFAVARTLDLVVSRDGGTTATVRNMPDADARPLSVLYDATGALWVGTFARGVYRSTDDGVTLTSIGGFASPPPRVYVVAWSPKGGAEGTLFAGTSDGLYRRIRGGSFERVLGGGGYLVSEVTVDPTCPSRIYAGFGYSFHSVHRGGVAMSMDSGSSWTSLSAGSEVHAVPVTSIQIAPGDPRRLYVATFGRGAWTYDHGVSPPNCQ